jgi:aspartyl-tRNA synthetase
MSYDEAMRRFGSDKPDLRFGLEHVVLTEVVKAHDGGLPLFEQAVAQGGMVKAMACRRRTKLSRTEVDKLEPEAKGVGALGLGRAKIAEPDGSWTQSPFARRSATACGKRSTRPPGQRTGDIVLFQFGPAKLVHTVLNHLRLLVREEARI